MSDIYDALLGEDANTPAANADLVARLRKQQVLGQIAQLTGIAGLQKMGPELQNDAQGQAMGLYKTRESMKDRAAARELQAAEATEREKDRMALGKNASDDRALQRENMRFLEAERLQAGQQTISDKAAATAQGKLDKQENSYNSLADSLDGAIAAVDRLHDHPGLSNITGLIGAHTWDLTDNARNASAQLENVRSKVMLNAMQALKAASPTGATGMGNLSNAEGDTLRNSIASLDKAQSYDEIRHSLETISATMALAKKRAKDALDRGAVSAAVGASGPTTTVKQGFLNGSALPLSRGRSQPTAPAAARPSLDDPRYHGG